jgi:hypothetical protein
MEKRCWKKIAKGLLATTNFLEVLVDDEETIMAELNRACGDDQHVFSGVRIPKRKLPIVINPAEEREEMNEEDEQRGANLGFEAVVKSKKKFHFIK